MLEIIAHRGASREAPENTLSSVRLAWEQRADAVEIDCRLTADGHIVVIHDADSLRTAGARHVVAATPLAVLRSLEYGNWKGAAFHGDPIPLLSEVIDTVPSGKRLFIEVKCATEILPPLEDVLRDARRPAADLVVISFHEAVLSGIKRRIPSVPTYLVAETRQHADSPRQPPTLDELIGRGRAANVDGLDVEASPAVDEKYVAGAARAGLACYVWTVDNADEARRLRAAGVRGITTNRPGWLREQLSASE